MRFLSVCSGIEAASVAWHPLGWECAAVAEVEPFPSAVLAHRFPEVPNLGDITASDFIERARARGPVQLLVGGTPCQSFSVAGLRKGLADPRGGLTLRFLEIARDLRPRWVVWENVPGVLSADKGRAFGAFLGGLAELGYGWAYRILDAQYAGVAQRRRRVFVVGCLGDWTAAAAVLLERHSLSGDPPPRREKGAGAARSLAACPRGGSGWRADADTAENLVPLGGGVDPARDWPASVAPTLNAHFGSKQGLEDQHALGGGGLFVPERPIFATSGQHNAAFADDAALALNSTNEPPYVATPLKPGHLIPEGGSFEGPATFQETGQGWFNDGPVAATVRTPDGGSSHHANLVAQKDTHRGLAENREAAGSARASTPGMPTGSPDQPEPLPFDPVQVTSPGNYSSPKPGDPVAPLAAGSAAGSSVCIPGEPRVYSPVDYAAGRYEERPVTTPVTTSRDPSRATPLAVDGYNHTLHEVAPTLGQNAGMSTGRNGVLDEPAALPAAQPAMRVRRLTPVECERLQGFPDNATKVPTYTMRHRKRCPEYVAERRRRYIEKRRSLREDDGLDGREKYEPFDPAKIPLDEIRVVGPTFVPTCKCKVKFKPADLCPDGPRYRALGNSFAVPVVAWIGKRIAMVDEVLRGRE